MSEETRLPSSKPSFDKQSFGGYNRAQVDDYLRDVADIAQRERGENEQLRSDREKLREELRQLREELDPLREQVQEELRKQEALHSQLERMAEIQAERDSYQALAERLASEDNQAKDMLRAAQKTVDEMRAHARSESDEMIREAEERTRRIREDAQRKLEALEHEYERMRKEYDEFLNNARDLAHGFVRKVDEARSPRIYTT